VGTARKFQEKYRALVGALRSVFPSPDYGEDEHITRTWDKCLYELTEVLKQNDPHFDASTFVTEIICKGLDPDPKGPSKQERRMLFGVGGIVLLSLLWAFHNRAVESARAEGHSDIYAMLCEREPGLAARFLPLDENGVEFRCKDFEHHFDND